MNLIKQGLLIAALVFIGSLIIGCFIFGRINWILSFGIAGGSLLGTLLRYLWLRDAREQKEPGD
ncbi:MAG: hypothetical protein OIN66_16890 [Candidatus Methanoperedens sp.]|nr:hypothetical protein [Candidatus Methanoperedens sp.]